MRPRLREDAYFAPVEEGVMWLGNRGSFLMRGASVAAVVQRLVPHLDGRRSVAQLTAPLAEEHRKLVVELVDTLVRLDLVHGAEDGHDAPHDAARTPPENPDRAFVEHATGRGAAGHAAFLTARAVVAGPERLVSECAEVLRRAGLADTTPVALDLAVDLGEDGARERVEDLVPGADACLVHVFGTHERARADQLARWCGDHGVASVQAMCAADGIYVRTGAPGDGPRWASVLRRLRGAEPTEHAERAEEWHLPEPGPRIIANQLALALFLRVTGATSTTGHPGRGVVDLVRIDPHSLERHPHRVLEHPWDRPARPRSRAEFADAVQRLREGGPLHAEGFSTRVMDAVDERFGPIRRVSEADLAQVPLRRARAEPAPATGAGAVTASGPDFASARRAAALRALGRYSSRMIDPRRAHLTGPGHARQDQDPERLLDLLHAGEAEATVWGMRLTDGRPCPVDVRSVFPALGSPTGRDGDPVGLGAGLDWAEMVADGLLSQVRDLAVTEAVSHRPGPLPDLVWPDGDGRIRRGRRLLTALGHATAALDLTGTTGVPTVAVAVDGTIADVTSRPRLSDALGDAVQGALCAVQAGDVDRHPDLTRLLRLRGTTRPGPVPHDLAGTDAVVAALARTGRAPVLVPLDHDPEVARICPYVANVVLTHV
ncbi:YcaO-like family protein [Nocardiopsis xinjiangensis]|uniref:YcaO-like family protein n=1 Tax=Nocardiopsis xinjiangensis TaxID=124285 RepID=UPI000344C738|nr:YcaO-like family protein [Nocardiopsis xinjiangensis]